MTNQPVCRLMVSTPRNPCNYMDYYSAFHPSGVGKWVDLVGWPIADTLPTKWSHVNHRSGTDQEKPVSQRPTPLPLSHATMTLWNTNPWFTRTHHSTSFERHRHFAHLHGLQQKKNLRKDHPVSMLVLWILACHCTINTSIHSGHKTLTNSWGI